VSRPNADALGTVDNAGLDAGRPKMAPGTLISGPGVTPPEGGSMCLLDRETLPARMDGEETLRLDRRTAIVGTACLALTATLPGSAAAPSAARARGRSTVAPPSRQSPIDLRRSAITFVRRLPTIRFRYPRRVEVRLVNTGSPGEFATVRADVLAGAAHITLRGVRWELEQFHWHTPSEHEIEGRRTPLEMHFVHTRADGAILVIAVLIERGRNSGVLEPMFRDLPGQPNDAREVSGVRLRALLPEQRESFRYTGSLTTPPFTEPVRWVLLAGSIRASRRQIGAFGELFDEGNSREVQPLNGRRIRSDARRLPRPRRQRAAAREELGAR
jgi:carbonic anhydrase